MTVTDVNPLHRPGRPSAHWSTANVGEAVPGVLTPLNWTLWMRTGDRGLRDVCYALGIFSARERTGPAPGEDPLIQIFFGRIAMSMEWLAVVGDRSPGTTGELTVERILGRVPGTMTFRPTRRRYPFIAVKSLPGAWRATRQIRRLAPLTESWWRRSVSEAAHTDAARCRALVAEAERRFNEVQTIHAVGLFGAVTPLVQALNSLVDRTGVGDISILSGTGGAEMRMVEDIWRASRGELTLDQVMARHGYHGPDEGEIASRVWREDPAPLEQLISAYAMRDEQDSPLRLEARARQRLPEVQRELIAAVPRWQRPGVSAVLRAAAATIPVRGVGKASFLQALDVARAASRRLGELAADDGLIDEPGDIFFLTFDEVTLPLPGDARERIAERRRIHSEYCAMRLPASWRGTPEPLPQDDVVKTDLISGIAASAGVIEGVVRVVTDPSFVDVEPGEVLVSRTTDPSWASIMFVSEALVVDVGGLLSHAAVVARELGIPCVINTRVACDQLRTGDRVRVDGAAGTVEILSRVAADDPTPVRS